MTYKFMKKKEFSIDSAPINFIERTKLIEISDCKKTNDKNIKIISP